MGGGDRMKGEGRAMGEEREGGTVQRTERKEGREAQRKKGREGRT